MLGLEGRWGSGLPRDDVPDVEVFGPDSDDAVAVVGEGERAHRRGDFHRGEETTGGPVPELKATLLLAPEGGEPCACGLWGLLVSLRQGWEGFRGRKKEGRVEPFGAKLTQ